MNCVRILGGGSVKSHREWGGSCFLVKIGEVNLVIDCGLKPNNYERRLPPIELLNGECITAFIATHAHADHIGAAPLLAELHPEAEIFATFETFALTRIQLEEQIKAAERLGEEPISSGPVCTGFLRRMQIVRYGEWLTVGKTPKIQFCLLPSGHIRGSASVLIKGDDCILVVSGDLSLNPTPTAEAARPLPNEFTVGQTVLLVDATAGNAVLPKREDEEERLVRRVSEVLEGGGNIIAPVSSIGRAQDVALTLAKAGIEVWLGGAAKSVLQSEAFGAPFFHENILAVTCAAEVLIRDEKPKVVVATHGMMEYGLSRELAFHWLSEPKNAIFIPGYQAPGTLGHKLSKAASGTPIDFKEFGVRTLSAAVEKFQFSGHADGPQLTNWIRALNPKAVFMVHAFLDAAAGLKQRLRESGYPKLASAASNGLWIKI